MGITKAGRFAAITNFRDLNSVNNNAPSRGEITNNFLISEIEVEDYYNELLPALKDYNGFNFIYGDVDELYYFSNKTDGLTKLNGGVYGLSNAVLNTSWPKVDKSKQRLNKLLENEEIHAWEVLNLLGDTNLAVDDELPDTGIGIEWERTLSAVFTKSPNYGTRCSTVVLVDNENNVFFVEKTFFSNFGNFSTNDFTFKIEK
jgi:uncharacterized protein with NRDE domain